MENNGGRFRKKKSNFSIVSNTAIHDPKISLKAKGLYTLIQSYITIEGFTLYKGFLQSQCRDGEKAFESGWKELKDSGYLKQYKMREGSNRFYYEYELLDEPETELNPLHPQKVPSSEVPYSDVPHTKSGSYNNTIQNNIIQNNTNQIISITDVMDQIGYEAFSIADSNQVKEIAMLITDVLNTPDNKKIWIGKEQHGSENVKARFKQLNKFHIDYVLECLKQNTTKIVNVKNYLLTALYNAPLTMDTYYQNKLAQYKGD